MRDRDPGSGSEGSVDHVLVLQYIEEEGHTHSVTAAEHVAGDRRFQWSAWSEVNLVFFCWRGEDGANGGGM